jgi:hypothetical protein
VAQTYGVGLPAARDTEILWTSDRILRANACHLELLAGSCNTNLPNGTNLLLVEDVVDYHELTHTVDLAATNLGLPAFFGEGVAARWEHGLGDSSQAGKAFYVGDVSHSEVLALLERWQIPTAAYWEAGFLWSWLEAEFGPHAMREFASRVDILSSPEKIEREFEATFGITLEMATDASRGQPMIAFDPLPCSMTQLPTLHWADEPLVVSAGPSTCAENDVVNSYDQAARYTRLELPADMSREYALELAGPMSGAAIHFYACRGKPLPYEDPMVLTPIERDWGPIWLRGTYIVILTATLEDSGHIPFPTATLKPWQP